MKHEEISKGIILNFKEATLTWKRVVRGNKENKQGLHG